MVAFKNGFFGLGSFVANHFQSKTISATREEGGVHKVTIPNQLDDRSQTEMNVQSGSLFASVPCALHGACAGSLSYKFALHTPIFGKQ